MLLGGIKHHFTFKPDMILEAVLWATAQQNLYLGPVSDQVMLKTAYSGSEIS